MTVSIQKSVQESEFPLASERSQRGVSSHSLVAARRGGAVYWPFLRRPGMLLCFLHQLNEGGNVIECIVRTGRHFGKVCELVDIDSDHCSIGFFLNSGRRNFCTLQNGFASRAFGDKCCNYRLDHQNRSCCSFVCKTLALVYHAFYSRFLFRRRYGSTKHVDRQDRRSGAVLVPFLRRPGSVLACFWSCFACGPP